MFSVSLVQISEIGILYTFSSKSIKLFVLLLSHAALVLHINPANLTSILNYLYSFPSHSKECSWYSQKHSSLCASHQDCALRDDLSNMGILSLAKISYTYRKRVSLTYPFCDGICEVNKLVTRKKTCIIKPICFATKLQGE